MQAIDKEKLKDLAAAVAFIDDAVEQGGSCLLHSSEDLTLAAVPAIVYFVVKQVKHVTQIEHLVIILVASLRGWRTVSCY